MRSAMTSAPARVGLGHDDGELLAAVAGHEVGGAGLRCQDARHAPQHQVAHRVAVGVVHRLEVVDVAEDDREPLAVALAPAGCSSSRAWKVRWLCRPVRPSVVASRSVCSKRRARRTASADLHGDHLELADRLPVEGLRAPRPHHQRPQDLRRPT